MSGWVNSVKKPTGFNYSNENSEDSDQPAHKAPFLFIQYINTGDS